MISRGVCCHVTTYSSLSLHRRPSINHQPCCCSPWCCNIDNTQAALQRPQEQNYRSAVDAADKHHPSGRKRQSFRPQYVLQQYNYITHPASPLDNLARFVGLLFLARELLRSEVSHGLPDLLVVALPRRCPRPLFPCRVSVGAVRGITERLLWLGTLGLRWGRGRALVACEPCVATRIVRW